MLSVDTIKNCLAHIVSQGTATKYAHIVSVLANQLSTAGAHEPAYAAHILAMHAHWNAFMLKLENPLLVKDCEEHKVRCSIHRHHADTEWARSVDRDRIELYVENKSTVPTK